MIVQTREDVFVSFINIEKDSAGTVLFLKDIMFCSTLSLSTILSSRAYCKRVSILHIFSEMLFRIFFSLYDSSSVFHSASET